MAAKRLWLAGLAAAAGLGAYAAAEPIKVPLLPVPVSQPKGEPPDIKPTIPELPPPARVVPPVVPNIPPPVVGAPPEVAPPARPAQSPQPAQPVGLPRPDFNLQSPGPGLNVNPSAPSPAPGETPVPIPTKQLLMSAAFGAALAASPLQAGAPGGGTGDPKTGDVKKADLDDIKDQLKTIKDDIKSLQEFRKTFTDLVLGTKDGAAGGQAGLVKQVQDLAEALKKIDDSLKRIETTLKDPAKSTSAFGPTTTTGKAFVRIVNEYPVEMSMMVNGKVRRVRPGESERVEVSPGSYTYELLHAGERPKTSTLKDGEEVTLRIR